MIRPLWLALFVAAMSSSGCDGEGVQAYAIPKEAFAGAHAHDHPGGHEPAPAGAEQELEWALPAGWQKDDAPRSMRYATLFAGEGTERLEVAVSRFPGDAGGLLANVNRWREQLGVAPVTSEELPATLREQAIGDRVAFVLDLPDASGANRLLAAVLPADAMTWFVKALAPEAIAARESAAFAAFVGSFRLVAGAPGPDHADPHAVRPAPVAETPPTWSVPAGWQAGPVQPGPRVASFTVSDGEARAEVAVTSFSGEVGGLLANLNRWRQQLGLAAVSDLAESPVTALTVDGAQASLIELEAAGHRMLVVYLGLGDRTWVFKMLGDGPLIAAQRDAFLAFVTSTELAEARRG